MWPHSDYESGCSDGILEDDLGMRCISAVRARRNVLAISVVALSLAGACASDSEEAVSTSEPAAPSDSAVAGPSGTATTPLRESQVRDDQLTDPCTLSPGTLRAAGLEADLARPNQEPGWKICSWNSADDQPFMTGELYVTKVSYQELLANRRYDRFAPTSVNQRPATYFQKAGDDGEECYIAQGTPTGTVWAAISAFVTDSAERSDPCQYVQHWADAAFGEISDR